MSVEQNIAIEERGRIKEITALGREFNLPHAASEAIESGMSIEDFKKVALEKLSSTAAKSNVISAGGHIRAFSDGGQLNYRISNKDAGEYSLPKAILADATAKEKNGSFDGIAGELSREISSRTARQPKGFFIPDFALTRNGGLATRDLSTLTQAAGAFTVESQVLGTELVDILRNRTYVMAAGAQYFAGLQGNCLIPRQTAPGTAYWLTENASVTESDQVFGQFIMQPHTLMGQTSFSKQLLAQSSIDVEGLVRNDLNAIIAIALDQAA
ncbi:MAG: phage major capsid protein, partial [Acidobacteria bacterium]